MVATLPASPASHHEILSALRVAIERGVGVAQLDRLADCHFTSWWHPLQQPLNFGGASPTFAIGLFSVVGLVLVGTVFALMPVLRGRIMPDESHTAKPEEPPASAADAE